MANKRVTLGSAERTAQAETATAWLLRAPELVAARTVAAYLSFGTEPSTRHLLTELAKRRVRILLPVLRDDHDLDWAEFAGVDRLSATGYGPSEPDTPRLGVTAVRDADVLVVPALAVDPHGVRLGRGRGCYDRVLSRVGGTGHARPWVVALLYRGETNATLPVEPHDRAVDAAATPDRLVRFNTM